MQKICVLGLGYIGLPTASLLATKGFKVHGVDVNAQTVETINRGNNHIHEPDLDVLVKSAFRSGNLVAALEPAPADVFILAVPTPLKEGHLPDITYIKAATRAIAPYLAPGNLVILESTIPLGTTEKVADWLSELRPDLIIPPINEHGRTVDNDKAQIFIAHCPERVLPGQILKELIDNDRIIGGIDQSSARTAQLFYERFVKGNILLTNARTAELCKLVENAFRDVNIAFANELSLICEKLDINVWELIDLANRHPRVNILQPGPGVGGHCIAIDPWFIVNSAPDEARLIRTAREVNDHKPQFVVTKIREKAARFKKPVIACLGLTFKADTDDLRESPAVEIVRQLAIKQAGHILAVEPYIGTLPATLVNFGNVQLADLKTALQRADLMVLLVNHRAFYDIGRELLNEKVVIDTRGIWR
ncbi:UDP-N-acetyl-D-mannosamine dehydrogenase [Desulfallas sp. Bu1-1]|uniref:UDP-N-acetyl-D-mannosamine dehydrogenase n=1 Tax=Desulfallas sp. Bu1-1 TaxID=2787620 RepID=UPI00189D2B65|nr:UDP-N-acetyl-D-mannosamine dehydrogenase [Desulfallas sp. Bu1-1]MBF7081438.1 UDP-N-acetyl-D-mannosamine dehydrogenase [Desulfallas sp. Bu1-1]